MKNVRQLYIAIIIGIIIAGIILRLIPAYQKPLQIDEAWTLYFANSNSYKELLFRAPVINDIHPGLYYVVVKLLLNLTTTIYGLRVASVLVLQMIGLIVFVLWGFKHKFNPLFLLIATAIFSFSPFLILQAWQLRMYGAISLWTSILGVLLYEYEYFGRKEKFLLGMIPAIFFFQLTHVSAYVFTLMLIITVMTLDFQHYKSLTKTVSKLLRPLVVGLPAFIIPVLSYYPFQFSTMFYHAVWVPVPTVLGALRIFPLEVLGLDSQSPLVVFVTLFIMAIVPSYVLLHIHVKQNSINYKNILLLLLTIFIVPVAAYIFSNVSGRLAVLPFFNYIIPPISIFLSRFFLPQAIYLHILLAVVIYTLYIHNNVMTKLLSILMMSLLCLGWLSTHKSTMFLSTNEREIQLFKSIAFTSIDPAHTLFYPGYTSLYSFDPQYHVPTPVSVSLYTKSAYFEDKIKNEASIFSCTEIQGGHDQFMTIQDKNIPTFFLQYEPNIRLFRQQYCIVQDNNEYATLFSCRCQKNP